MEYLDFPTAWAIQKDRGHQLDHHKQCSSVPGWHTLSGPAFLCDCGAIEIEWRRKQLTASQKLVLSALSDDWITRVIYLLPGQPMKDVDRLDTCRELRNMGLAMISPWYTDDGLICGSGYHLTYKGLQMQRSISECQN